MGWKPTVTRTRWDFPSELLKWWRSKRNFWISKNSKTRTLEFHTSLSTKAKSHRKIILFSEIKKISTTRIKSVPSILLIRTVNASSKPNLWTSRIQIHSFQMRKKILVQIVKLRRVSKVCSQSSRCLLLKRLVRRSVPRRLNESKVLKMFLVFTLQILHSLLMSWIMLPSSFRNNWNSFGSSMKSRSQHAKRHSKVFWNQLQQVMKAWFRLLKGFIWIKQLKLT